MKKLTKKEIEILVENISKENNDRYEAEKKKILSQDKSLLVKARTLFSNYCMLSDDVKDFAYGGSNINRKVTIDTAKIFIFNKDNYQSKISIRPLTWSDKNNMIDHIILTQINAKDLQQIIKSLKKKFNL